MIEPFLRLSDRDGREALLVASGTTGRSANLLEKDVWVVWTLNVLFQSAFGEHLVFKGGTSLSKAYDGLISRFSEDIDLTYDIRKLIPEMAGDGDDPLPSSKSQAGKWSDAVRKQLPIWIAQAVLPAIDQALHRDGLTAEVTHEGDKVSLHYRPLIGGTAYVPDRVLLEFGARSTGEPASIVSVSCYAAAALPQLAFPTATPRVMAAERTFWEKATAAHVYCMKGEFRGERYARHWHDLMKLYLRGVAATAIANRDLAAAVAQHKQAFFRERTPDGAEINYAEATGGALRLVPEGEARRGLEEDYAAMIADRLFDEEPVPFEDLMAHCQAIEQLANAC